VIASSLNAPHVLVQSLGDLSTGFEIARSDISPTPMQVSSASALPQKSVVELGSGQYHPLPQVVLTRSNPHFLTFGAKPSARVIQAVSCSGTFIAYTSLLIIPLTDLFLIQRHAVEQFGLRRRKVTMRRSWLLRE
jgi:hypothetical protein